jgi:hypothetical protein
MVSIQWDNRKEMKEIKVWALSSTKQKKRRQWGNTMPTSGFLLGVILAFYWPENYDFDTYKCFLGGENGPNLPELKISI